MKKLTQEIIDRVETECLLMLLAERDCYATWLRMGELKEMPKGFNVGRFGGGYHAEAFGIMRGLVALGYCYMGANNLPPERTNAKYWLDQLELQALTMEREFGLATAYKRQSEYFRETYNTVDARNRHRMIARDRLCPTGVLQSTTSTSHDSPQAGG